jgi:hypothetical protein
MAILYHDQRNKKHELQRLTQRRHTLGSVGSLLRESPVVSSLERSERVSAFVTHIRRSFLSDAKALAEGTIPQSIILALVIGTLCGIFAFFYYSVLEFLLGLL